MTQEGGNNKPDASKKAAAKPAAKKKKKRTRATGESGLHVKVKTAKGRRISSKLWLERQLNDPYVKKAQADGYRSRAAYKLIEMDERYNLLHKGGRIVDLGAAPGGWAQVAVKKVGPTGKVIGIDLQEMDGIEGAELITMDFMADEAPDVLKQMLGGSADLVMSDMAAHATGHKGTDHIKIMALAETALMFAEEVLAPGGAFVAKVLQGGTEADLLAQMRRQFKTVRHVKPKASRADSKEMYVLAQGFRRSDD
ncbi:MAG: RlmE family RNA methyltransferase [Alphaproteobacteria bacterium]